MPQRANENPNETWVSWDTWKAQALNRLFLEQGKTRKPARITAATVQHGESRAR